MKNHNKKISMLIILMMMISFLTGCVDQSGGDTKDDPKSTIESTAESTLKNGTESASESAHVESSKKEERIISTSVVISEILDHLDIDTVVGVPKSDTYQVPKRYESVDTIGAPMSPDMEIVSSLEPTCILSPISLEGSLLEKYEAIKVDSYFVNLSSTKGMFESIEELGERFEKQSEASKLIEEYENFMEEYKSKNAGDNVPKVLVLMGLPGSYVVATEASYAGSLVKLAGGKNVYEEETVEPFLNINPEDMVDRDPDIILLTSHALPEQVEKMFEEEFANNDIWKHFRAVVEEKIYSLDHEKFGMSANFKYKDALADLEEILYKK